MGQVCLTDLCPRLGSSQTTSLTAGKTATRVSSSDHEGCPAPKQQVWVWGAEVLCSQRVSAPAQAPCFAGTPAWSWGAACGLFRIHGEEGGQPGGPHALLHQSALRLSCGSETPVSTYRLLGCVARVPDVVVLAWGPRICISNEPPRHGRQLLSGPHLETTELA